MPVTEELVQGHSQPHGLLAEGINRAYVQEGALARWALASQDDATEVLWFMAAHKLARTVGNNLSHEPLIDLENAWEGDSTLEEISGLLVASDQQRYMDPFFRRAAVTLIGMDLESSSVGEGPITEKLVPIGGPLFSSCFDQNYHTYAFNAPGNKKMRKEEGPMANLAGDVANGKEPRLALVNGPNGDIFRDGKSIYEFNIAAIAKGIKVAGDYLTPVSWSVGPNGTMQYVQQRRPKEPLPLEDILGVKEIHGKDGLDKLTRNNYIGTIISVRLDMVFDIVHKQRKAIGEKRYEGRIRQLEHLKSEIARHVGGHRLIRKEFYPKAN